MKNKGQPDWLDPFSTHLKWLVFGSQHEWPDPNPIWPNRLPCWHACPMHSHPSIESNQLWDIITYYRTMCDIWGINCNKIKVYFMAEYRTKEMKSKKSYMQSHWDVKSSITRKVSWDIHSRSWSYQSNIDSKI